MAELTSLLKPSKCNRVGCNKSPKLSGFCREHYSEYRNIKRITSNGVTGGAPGVRGGKKKLSENDCKQIKRMIRVQFKTMTYVAKEFGVDQKLIKQVLIGEYVPESK